MTNKSNSSEHVPGSEKTLNQKLVSATKKLVAIPKNKVGASSKEDGTRSASKANGSKKNSVAPL